MEMKKVVKLFGVIFVLLLVAYFPVYVLCTETKSNLQLLAIGIILSIVLGGFNMLKSLFRSETTKAIEKANKLTEERYNRQYQNAKDQLKKYLNEFVLSCETTGGNKDQFQKKISEKRNELKRVVRVIEGRLILPQDILNEVDAIASESMTLSKGSGVPVVGTMDLSTLINQKSQGGIVGRDKLIERAKEIIKILGEENE
jgi:uncharacterized protein YacL